MELIIALIAKGAMAMTTKNKHPKVPAEAQRCSDGVWDLTIICPYCGKRHLHGGGNGPLPFYGFRAPHCGALRDYELVPVKGE